MRLLFLTCLLFSAFGAVVLAATINLPPSRRRPSRRPRGPSASP